MGISIEESPSLRYISRATYYLSDYQTPDSAGLLLMLAYLEISSLSSGALCLGATIYPIQFLPIVGQAASTDRHLFPHRVKLYK